MTDETEAVGMALCQNALGPKQCPCAEKGVFKCADTYPGYQAKAAITALDKHRIERAGEVERGLNGRSCSLVLNTKAAATIAALRAEIERGRQVIAEIAEFCANTGKGNPIVDERIIDRVEEAAVEYLRALDAEAIAKGEG